MPRAIWKAKQMRSLVVRVSESVLTEHAACDGFACNELT